MIELVEVRIVKVSNRFLIIFGISIIVFIIIVACIAALSGSDRVQLLPIDTPEGVVQHFLLAVKDQDYEQAYQYLSPPGDFVKEDFYSMWIRSTQYSRNQSSWKASIVSSNVKDNSATVNVRIDIFRPDVIFRDPVSSNHIAFMLQKEDAGWKIIQPTDIWWIY